MNRLERIADRLTGASSEAHRMRRRIAGMGFAAGFLVSLVGSAVSGSAWWLLALPVGAVGGWRVATGGWPFGRDRR